MEPEEEEAEPFPLFGRPFELADAAPRAPGISNTIGIIDIFHFLVCLFFLCFRNTFQELLSDEEEETKSGEIVQM